MISLTDDIGRFEETTAELIKIQCLYDCYKADGKVLFWCQDTDRAVISLTDGNMIIHNRCADTQELREFAEVLDPVCIFSDYDTLCSIGRKPEERINVMSHEPVYGECDGGDILSSKEIYGLLDTEGLSLPAYPYFAVDYCRRLNRGKADYFGISGKCAVITFNSGKNALINGIASHEKGYGSLALKNILKINQGRRVYVCCRDKVTKFYEKNGFTRLYYAGYWLKNK